MKTIKVLSQCNACGICTMQSKYLKEDAEGNPEVIPGIYVDENNKNEIMEIIQNCPMKAIEIVDKGYAKQDGKEGLKELLSVLKEKYGNYKLPNISTEDIAFHAEDYPIEPPYFPEEGWNKFSSESQARSAARNAFMKSLGSESAYRPILKQIFVEYKVRVLKPYYTDDENSFYYKLCKGIEKDLKEIYAETKLLSAGKDVLSEEWAKFEVYPVIASANVYDGEVYMLQHFEDRSMDSGIISALKDLQSIDSYIDYVDYDYDEEYAGEGMFGREKYVKKWRYDGLRDAAKDFIKDLKWAMKSGDPGIQEAARYAVECAFSIYEKKVIAALQAKITEYEKLVK